MPSEQRFFGNLSHKFKYISWLPILSYTLHLSSVPFDLYFIKNTYLHPHMILPMGKIHNLLGFITIVIIISIRCFPSVLISQYLLNIFGYVNGGKFGNKCSLRFKKVINETNMVKEHWVQCLLSFLTIIVNEIIKHIRTRRKF